MSGEVAGVVGIIGFVLSLEFQYRYHQYLMDVSKIIFVPIIITFVSHFYDLIDYFCE